MAEGSPSGHEKTILAPASAERVNTPLPGPLPTAAAAGRRCPTCGGDFPADFRVCPRDATPLNDVASGDDPLLGAVLAGTYRVTRFLAEGGMGRVYEAEHIRLERRLAIKVCHEMYAKGSEGVARFEREARATAKIRSDYLVGVIDVLRTPDGRPCIVSELLEGEDLQVRLDRLGKLPLAEAIPLTRQICRALSDAHAHGIVHRDLKPSNVFLVAGRVKILDFGVAKTTDDRNLTQTGAVLGTPAYMSPEQARGSHEVDARADIYAAGAVLYRMLTGQPPYGKEVTNPLARLLHEEPDRPRALDKSIPEGVEAVIQHAMARDPDDRPATALDLERELGAFDIAPDLPAVRDPVATTAVISPSLERQATQITRRARLTRPSALGILVGAGLTTGLAMAAVLAAVVRQVNKAGGLTSTEAFLVDLVAAAVAVATAGFMVRALSPRWKSVPAVGQLTNRVARALGVGLFTFGALSLLTRGLAAILHWTKVTTPGAAAISIGVAAACSIVALSRQRHS